MCIISQIIKSSFFICISFIPIQFIYIIERYQIFDFMYWKLIISLK